MNGRLRVFLYRRAWDSLDSGLGVWYECYKLHTEMLTRPIAYGSIKRRSDDGNIEYSLRVAQTPCIW